MGSNMAEQHPVGFQWVIEAKERGAKVIHVDPRFTRTSAMADVHVRLRPGTDIAFLGGVINYILSGDRDFKEYVARYTNAATIIDEGFRDTDELDGLFSGFNADDAAYDISSWGYAGTSGETAAGKREQTGDVSGDQAHGAHGMDLPHGRAPETDRTLEHPNCVYQILRRHFARYTPEMVEEVCGVPPARLRLVAEALCENSGRERTSAIVYSVGWTQHTHGVQNIRAASIISLLLGNMGRPGGGILALRGHANIQGSTDIPTLFDILPGYIPMPHPKSEGDVDTFAAENGPATGAWGNLKAYTVSLLKAWWGDAATPESDFCFGYLPLINGDHSVYPMMVRMLDRKTTGYMLLGQNPAVGSANASLQRRALASLDWLVVRDFSEIESAAFWYDSREIDAGELRTEDIGTEVFFLPAAAHTEKDGSFTNTQRLLQWHHKAVEPKEDCRSDLWFAYHLGRRIREKLAGSTDPKDRPILDLLWEYPLTGPHDEPDADAILQEINGRAADGSFLPKYEALADDGSTSCGSWIHCGIYADGVNQPARKRPHWEQNGSRRTGDGRGRRTPGSSTTVRRPPPTGRRGPSARSTCGGTPSRGSGPRAAIRRTSRPTSRPTTSRPRAPRRWRRSAATRRSSFTPTATAGSTRPPVSSTARCPRTTSRTRPPSPTRSTPSAPTRRASASTGPRTRTTPAPRSRATTCSRTS